jgi:hypothetical protein
MNMSVARMSIIIMSIMNTSITIIITSIADIVSYGSLASPSFC